MNRALIDRMISCMDPAVTSNYKQTTLMTNPKSRYLDVFQHFFDLYGAVSPNLEEKNGENIRTKWLPNQGTEVLIYQIEQGMVFAHFTKNPFTDKQLVSSFMLQIIGAEVYAPYLKDWRARD